MQHINAQSVHHGKKLFVVQLEFQMKGEVELLAMGFCFAAKLNPRQI
jgi:hypothetical protein